MRGQTGSDQVRERQHRRGHQRRGGQVHCTERVRRRTTCGAASATNAIEPVHTGTDAAHSIVDDDALGSAEAISAARRATTPGA